MPDYIWRHIFCSIIALAKMEIIASNRGMEKLCYAGYAYTKQKQSKTTIRWECTHRRSQQCKGALTTDLAATEVRSTTEYSLEADQFTISALKVRAEIKASVEANRGKPGQIVTDKLATVPKEVASAAGRIDSLKRVVRRAKRGTAPTEPESMKDIPHPLPEAYTTMRGDGSFLIYDNGSRIQRLLVFASDDGLDLLGDANACMVHGRNTLDISLPVSSAVLHPCRAGRDKCVCCVRPAALQAPR